MARKKVAVATIAHLVSIASVCLHFRCQRSHYINYYSDLGLHFNLIMIIKARYYIILEQISFVCSFYHMLVTFLTDHCIIGSFVMIGQKLVHYSTRISSTRISSTRISSTRISSTRISSTDCSTLDLPGCCCFGCFDIGCYLLC